MPYTALTPEEIVTRAIKRSTRKHGALDRLATDTQCKVEATCTDGVTGTWQFDSAANTHQITLGTKFRNGMKLRPKGAKAQSGLDSAAIDFGVQILRHEAWHGRVTVRDLRAIAAQCKTRSIPFLLVNLMEDMRLEHLAREAEGVPFEWRLYLPYTIPTNPLAALANMSMYETDMCYTFTANHPKHATHGKVWREKVEDFAKRIKAAADTFVVVDIAQEWLEYWRGEGWADDTQRVPTGTMVDGAIGGDRDGSEVNHKGLSQKGGSVHTVSNNTRNIGTVAVNAPRTVPVTEFNSYSGALPLDTREAEAVANEMRTILARTASQHTARTSSSGSRLHIAGIASRSSQCFRSYGKTGGKPHLIVLMDFSGSMARDWKNHGRLFTAAVLRLLRSGAITGKLYATGGGNLAEIPAHTTDQQLNALCPHTQGENIRDSLTALRQELAEADAVLVYTDGELMDGHVDAGEWRRKGVDLVGTVVIPATRTEDHRKNKIAMMTQHFGAPVVAENGKQLARKIAQHLGQRWR